MADKKKYAEEVLSGVKGKSPLFAAAGLHKAIEADEDNRAIEQEIARHNKSLFTRPGAYNPGDEYAVSDNQHQIMSRLDRNGHLTEPGLSRDAAHGGTDNSPKAHRDAYARMVNKQIRMSNAQSRHGYMASDEVPDLPAAAQQMRGNLEGQLNTPVMGRPQAAPASTEMLNHIRPVSFDYKPGEGRAEADGGVCQQDARELGGAAQYPRDGAARTRGRPSRRCQ